ncbi:MAG: AbrB family transcriptional regulator, partial [Actinobacteria bacterium]|nr:AbrB family transcriptional regulator [Actinomycetota bacterium]
VFHPGHGRSSVASATAPLAADLAFVAVALVLGLVIAALVPVTTAVLLGPMLVASVIAAGGWLGAVVVPTGLQWLAYALIGIQVGLRFTRASLAAITRMLPTVVALIVAIVVATAAMGAVLAWSTSVDGLTAYLATTPGGLFAVLATAADSGADATYVLAVQIFRLLVILLLTPVLARWLGARAGGGDGPDGGSARTG